jgi:hypothetical protein
MSTKLPDFFDKFINSLLPSIKKNLNDRGGLVPVAFVGNSERGTTEVVGMMFTNQEEKDKYCNFIRKIAKEGEADFVVMISESWSVPAEHSEEFINNRDKYPTIESFPKREEIVVVMIETETTRYIGRGVISGESGRRVVGELEFGEGQIQGRFSYFLGPKGVVN